MGRKWATNLVKSLTALGLLVGTLSTGMPHASAQALIPYVANFQFANNDELALMLAREAAQLSQFERHDLALPRALLAVQLAPKSYQTQGILGNVYLRQEKYDQAIATLKLANSLKANEPAILFSLGSAYLRKGVYPEAIRVLEQGLALVPTYTSGLFDLANALFLSKRYEEAIAKYDRILELDKKFWAATNNIGLVEYERGNRERAMQHWKASLEQAEQIEFQAAEPTLALAVAYYAMGEKEKGIKLGEEAMKIDPRYGRVPHLIENLWGERLIADTKPILEHPRIKKLIEESEKLLPISKRQR